MLSSVPMLMGSSDSIVDGIQPLTSNVANKQPSTMEAQYMQQQSHIFVFSTALANASAESVLEGRYPSIIAYHVAQPRTKKYLERHPLKLNQFNRQNPVQWLNHIAQFKPKNAFINSNRCSTGRGNFRSNSMINSDVPSGGSELNVSSCVPVWNQQGNMNPMNINNNNQHGLMLSPMCNNNNMQSPGPGPLPTQINNVLPGQMGLNTNTGMIPNRVPMKCPSQPLPVDMLPDASNSNLLSSNVLPDLGDFSEDQLPLSPHKSLTGVKVPDENLTPKQRLHREEQLATLRKLEAMLSLESHQSPSHHPINSDLQSSVHNQINVNDLSSVLTGNGNGDSTTDISNMQKTTPTATTHTDWPKMQQFFDDRKRKSDVTNIGRCGTRSQEPPPPYHATRSASVPIAIPSPNPNSPSNTTSNLSLPSPRTCSGLNSPASKQGPGPSPTANSLNTSIDSPNQTSHSRGLNVSNPGTPVSSTMHLSPNSKQKETKLCSGTMSNEFSPATSNQQSPDGIFGRSLQSLAQQQQQKQQPQLPLTQSLQSANSHCKEPNLMPVPSPQHIQYLNTFEGQELTIQKQPNTSLKDTGNIVSPSLSSATLDTIIPAVSTAPECSKVSLSAPNTPLTPSSLEISSSRYPGTPADFTALSPNPNDTKSQIRSANPVMGSDNVPLNPTINPATKSSQFDPISSLAQMSQQLTNNVPGSPGTQSSGMMHSGMMPYGGPGSHMPNSIHLMQMNEMNMCGGGPTNDVAPSSMSDNSRMMYNQQMAAASMNIGMGNNVVTGRMMPCPNNNELSGGGGSKSMMQNHPYQMMSANSPRMMARTPGMLPNSYNGANIQVKPNAPNTIQYLPNRPQVPPQPPVGSRAPPSLEFLQRFPNPVSNMDNKMQPQHNMNYFSPNNQYSSGPPGNNMNDMMGNMNCNMPPGNPMIRNSMRPGNPGNVVRMNNMGIPPYANEQMYQSAVAPNQVNMPNNCHMFMTNSGPTKLNSMNMPSGIAPDTTQPLAPSIGQSNNFKNSPFMVPTTNDPAYAQQFHNFQQQLYATNTRSHMNNQPMAGPNQQYFVPK